MGELKTINLRDANQRFSELIRHLENGEEGYVVLKHGKPVAQILPAAPAAKKKLTPEQEAALQRILTTKFDRPFGRFDREEAYQDRLERFE